MDDGTKVGILLIVCVTLVIITFICCYTYYSLEYDKFVERVIDKGVNPAVITCIDSTWTTSANALICSEVFRNNHMTKEEAEKLRNSIETEK